MSDSIDTPPPAPEPDNRISKKRKTEQKVWLKEIQVNKFQSGIKYCLTGVTQIDSSNPTEHAYYYKNKHYAQADQRRLVEALQTPRSKSDGHFKFVKNEDLQEWTEATVQAELLTAYRPPRKADFTDPKKCVFFSAKRP